MDVNEFFGEPIHVYTRADAIADGVLIDATEMAREAGIRFPTAITHGAWHRYVEPDPMPKCQDVAGRLWDTLWMFRHAAGQVASGCSCLEFTVVFRMNGKGGRIRNEYVKLKAVCGPGDNAEPVVTIMLPDED